jgi:hypothetical protein
MAKAKKTKKGESKKVIQAPHICCVAWVDGIRAINGAMAVSALHDGPCTRPVFVFCPWCGKKLPVPKLEELW